MEQKIITIKDAEDAKKKADHLRKARNKARALIKDALARYVKEKTRAKSKKEALEKEALTSSPRFTVLNDYDRIEDIQEAYGYDIITESERDRLEALWRERDEIKMNVNNGVYQDNVTEALDLAISAIIDIWEDQIEEAEKISCDFKKQKEKAEREAQEWMDRQNAEYEKHCVRS